MVKIEIRKAEDAADIIIEEIMDYFEWLTTEEAEAMKDMHVKHEQKLILEDSQGNQKMVANLVIDWFDADYVGVLGVEAAVRDSIVTVIDGTRKLGYEQVEAEDESKGDKGKRDKARADKLVARTEAK